MDSNGRLINSLNSRHARRLAEYNMWSRIVHGCISTPVAAFPWDESVLDEPCPFVANRTVGETHLPFPGITDNFGRSPSLEWWAERDSAAFSNENLRWCLDNGFGKAILDPHRWHLMPIKGAVCNGVNATFAAQHANIPPGYEPALWIEALTMAMLLRSQGWSDENVTLCCLPDANLPADNAVTVSIGRQVLIDHIPAGLFWTGTNIRLAVSKRIQPERSCL